MPYGLVPYGLAQEGLGEVCLVLYVHARKGVIEGAPGDRERRSGQRCSP